MADDLAPLRSLLAPDPDAEYGTYLPVARNREGSASWVTGGNDTRLAMSQAQRSGLLGGADLMQGQPTPEAIQTLLTISGLSLGAVPQGGFGIFGGPGARTANLSALERAKTMPRTPAWNETGWFQGKDRKWRTEINDQDARLTMPHDQPVSGVQTLGDILDHEALYRAYPALRDAQIDFGDFGGTRAIAQPQEHSIYLNNSILKPNPKDRAALLSTLLHESQHMVQGYEKFAPGASPGMANVDKLPRDWPSQSFSRSNTTSHEAYLRSAGETEARNVQARQAMSRPDRIYRPPWETEDVPSKSQIVQKWRDVLGTDAPGMFPSRQALQARGLLDAPEY